MRLLLIGLNDIKDLLINLSCTVEIADIDDVDDIVDYLLTGSYEACLINLDVKGLGIYMRRSLRAKKIETAILGISSGGVMKWSDYRALFLENGGDDLMRAPANPREIVASINSIIRRGTLNKSDIIKLIFNDIEIKINLPAFSVSVQGKHLHLTIQEYKIFTLLVKASGRTITKEAVMSALYFDSGDEPEIKIVDVFICKLRKKLNDTHAGLGKFIETVWGRGYVLVQTSFPNSKAA